MLQYLINVTDNTFIPAIIFALLVVALRINCLRVRRTIYIGMLIGFIIATIYAVLKRNTGFMVREYYDLAICISWVVLVIPVIISMWFRHFSHCDRAHSNCFKIFIALNIGALVAIFMPNLLLYPFGFSVGMDSIFNTDYLFKWVGYFTALLIVTIAAYTIYSILMRLSYRFSLLIITLGLLIYSLQSLVTISQILIVRRFIPQQKWLMSMIMFVLSHVNLFVFIFIILSLFIALSIFIKGKITPIRGQNPAQIRRVKSEIRQDRRTCLAVLATVAITAYTVTRLRNIYETGAEISPAEPITLNENGLLVIPLEKINDGNLHRYGYETNDGTIVRFIIIKKSENAYGVGLDACDICGASGYYQRGDQVVCSLCDVVMNIATIGFQGGCNPVPLKFEIIDGNLLIKPRYLEAEKYRFK
ncbi:DUF2318 domain-containing protein [Orbaceae bacterium ac157xtp]